MTHLRKVQLLVWVERLFITKQAESHKIYPPRIQRATKEDGKKPL